MHAPFACYRSRTDLDVRGGRIAERLLFWCHSYRMMGLICGFSDGTDLIQG